VKRLPKLSPAVDCGSHWILAAIASTGGGGDQPFFELLLFEAWRRSDTVKRVVADAGYDSDQNLQSAERDMNVRAIIPARAGRPSDKPAISAYRRAMQKLFAGDKHKPMYGQRWQCETVNSMIERNLGSASRARTAVRRRHEMPPRVLTHNIMIPAQDEGQRQSRYVSVSVLDHWHLLLRSERGGHVARSAKCGRCRVAGPGSGCRSCTVVAMGDVCG
jgi:hypothetical protein